MLLNNQLGEDKLNSHHQTQHQLQQAPLKKIANNLANTVTAVSDDNNNSLTCNPCKESQSSQSSQIKKSSSCASSHCSSSKKAGVVNLAFVDNLTEQSSWYQPHLARELAVRLLTDSPVGTFLVRNSRSQGATGHLALSVRVPTTYSTAGILHYLIMVTEAGFRIKGFSKVFSSLSGLVVHHSVMMESLPCRLLINAPPQHSDGEEEDDRDSDFADLEADPEYPGLLSRLREQLSSD